MANTLNLGNGNWGVKKDSLLGYNSENGNFKPLAFNFTRASSATVVNKAGLIETVGSGEPRIDFSNDTKGALLLEPQRSNLITYSEEFSNWAQDGATTLDNNIISPDGTLNASKITFNSGNERVYTFANTTNGSFSAYFKGVQGKKVKLRDNSGTYRTEITLTENWVRHYLYKETANTNIQIQNVDANEVYVWGAQVEEGSYATSYIPTSGQSGGVTRVADACNNGGNEQVINSTEGVLYAQISALSNSGDTYRLISLNNGSGTNTNRIFIGYTNNNSIYAAINNTTIAFTTSSFDVKNFNKVAVVYNGSIAKLFINGSEVGSGITNASTLSGLSRVDFSGSSTGANEFKGNTKDVRVYTTALTDAELQALTRI